MMIVIAIPMMSLMSLKLLWPEGYPKVKEGIEVSYLWHALSVNKLVISLLDVLRRKMMIDPLTDLKEAMGEELTEATDTTTEITETTMTKEKRYVT